VNGGHPSSRAGRVVLRNIVEADLPILFEQQLEPDAIRMAAFPPREREAFMAHWAKILADETCHARAIVFDGRVAGNIGAWEADGRRLLGYWIGKEFWGKGIATKALTEFLRVEKVRPIQAYVAKHNAASIRVLEKCGFTVCGEDRSVAPTGGEGVEEFVYLLHGRPPPVVPI